MIFPRRINLIKSVFYVLSRLVSSRHHGLVTVLRDGSVTLLFVGDTETVAPALLSLRGHEFTSLGLSLVLHPLMDHHAAFGLIDPSGLDHGSDDPDTILPPTRIAEILRFDTLQGTVRSRHAHP